jgi:hypothetical protein
MKMTFRILVGLLLVGVLITYSGCGSRHHDEEPITDQQIDKLNQTWKVSAVSLDGANKTSDYTSTSPIFQIALSGTHGSTTVNYTCTGRPSKSPWPASGSFTFVTTAVTDPQTKLTRDDAVPVTYSVTTAQLELAFVYSGAGFDARTANVSGQWVFTFVPL